MHSVLQYTPLGKSPGFLTRPLLQKVTQPPRSQKHRSENQKDMTSPVGSRSQAARQPQEQTECYGNIKCGLTAGYFHCFVNMKLFGTCKLYKIYKLLYDKWQLHSLLLWKESPHTEPTQLQKSAETKPSWRQWHSLRYRQILDAIQSYKGLGISNICWLSQYAVQCSGAGEIRWLHLHMRQMSLGFSPPTPSPFTLGNYLTLYKSLIQI